MTALPVLGSQETRRQAWWIPALVIAALFLPMLVTRRSFGADWTLHLWLLRQQQLNIHTMLHPGLFVSVTGFGAFYPLFSFVGSGLYTVGGFLAIALGGRPLLAYKLLNLVGLCLGFGGMTWLALQLGVRGWRAQVPGVAFVTGFYFLDTMMGRGDFGEFMALASIPFLIAGGFALLTSPSLRKRHVFAVTVGTFVFTGSHNITLLLGSLFLALLAVVVIAARGSIRESPADVRRIGWLVAAVAVGAGMNAWFLVPDILYGSHTTIGMSNRGIVPVAGTFGSPAGLLNPVRPVHGLSKYGHNVRVALPWMFLAWGIAVAATARGERCRLAKRICGGLVVVVGVMLLLAVWQTPWKALPTIFYNVQFAWRLGGCVLIATSLLVMGALLLQARGCASSSRVTTYFLVAIVGINAGAAVLQVWQARSQIVLIGSHRVPELVHTRPRYLGYVVASRDEKPTSWYSSPNDFTDASVRVVKVPRHRFLAVPTASVHGSKFVGSLPLPDGRAPFATNIAGSPDYIRMSGIRPVGRTHLGYVVAVRAADAPATGPVVVTIQQASTAVLRAGSALSMLSVAILLGFALFPMRLLARRRETEVALP